MHWSLQKFQKKISSRRLKFGMPNKHPKKSMKKKFQLDMTNSKDSFSNQERTPRKGNSKASSCEPKTFTQA